MCLIYDSDEERLDVISKFVESGLKSGERVGYFCDDETTDGVKEWLTEKGVNIAEAEANNQLILAPASTVYYPTGEFVPEQMMDNLIAFHNYAVENNYPSSRVTGEMCWATRGVKGSERLIEYESQGKVFLARYPVTVVCQYDANKFDGAILLECLKVHPFMIVYGQIVRNPYYSSEYKPRISHSS
jgi:hypothetical protein